MKLLLTGDSIVARHEGLSEPHINAYLKENFSDIEIVNTAVPGINSRYLLAHLNELVLKQVKADYLIILIGTNDCAFHKKIEEEEFWTNLNKVAKKILNKYEAKQVILVSPPAVDEEKQRVRDNETVEKYANWVQRVANDYGMHYLNLFHKMNTDDHELEEICHGLRNDSLHFGKIGYQIFGDGLIDEIRPKKWHQKIIDKSQTATYTVTKLPLRILICNIRDCLYIVIKRMELIEERILDNPNWGLSLNKIIILGGLGLIWLFISVFR